MHFIHIILLLATANAEYFAWRQSDERGSLATDDEHTDFTPGTDDVLDPTVSSTEYKEPRDLNMLDVSFFTFSEFLGEDTRQTDLGEHRAMYTAELACEPECGCTLA